MTVFVISQAYIFLCTVVGGMVIALIYDIFRIKRRAFKTGNLLTYVEDLLFWVIVAVIMFITVYYSNEGELRSYLFLGIVLGVILYALILSKPIMNSSLFIINIAGKIFKSTLAIIFYPARISSKYVGKLVHSIRVAGRNRLFKVAVWKKVFRNMKKKI